MCKEILDTLGKEDTPPALVELAMTYRQSLCEALGVQTQADDGLHGRHLHALAERLGDPDVLARAGVSAKQRR